jgi:RNA polymerase sigma factor (sigma-70 family)
MGAPERPWAWLVSNQAWLHNTLRRRVRQPADAEDAAQEALLRAASAVSPPRSRAWLVTTAQHYVIGRWRHEYREEPLEVATDIADIARSLDAEIDLARALRALRPADRALLAAVSRGITYAEIAAAGAVPLATVRQRVARARARLLKQLATPGGSS